MAPCEYHDTIDWTDDLNNTFKEIARKPYYPYSAKYRVLEEIKQPGEDTLRIILTNILRSRAYRTKEGWERAKARRHFQPNAAPRAQSNLGRFGILLATLRYYFFLWGVAHRSHGYNDST
jgi:hypothetical protein